MKSDNLLKIPGIFLSFLLYRLLPVIVLTSLLAGVRVTWDNGIKVDFAPSKAYAASTGTISLVAWEDDAYEKGDGTHGCYSETIPVYSYTNSLSSNYSCGAFRIQNVTLPKGTNINSANFSINVSSAAYDDANFKVYCESVDNSTDFSSNYHIINRARTTAYTSVVADGVGAGWYIVDVTSQVQEVVNRAGWWSGNAMTFLLVANTDSGKALLINSRDSDSQYRATLSVTYGEGSGDQTVTTDTVTAIGETSATVTGSITNVGSGNATSWGFQIGTTSGIYASSWTATGSRGVGSFSHQFTSLTLGQAYYVRTFTLNASGYTYGNELAFTPRTVSLWGTAAEWAARKALLSTPPWSSMWSDLQSWCNTHINDGCPAGNTLGDGNRVKNYVTRMLIAWHLSDNTIYRDAAMNWATTVANTWNDWDDGDKHQGCYNLAIALAGAYYDLHDYMSSQNRSAMLYFMTHDYPNASPKSFYDNPSYGYQAFYQSPWDSVYCAFPVTLDSYASVWGIIALALGTDYQDSQNWLDYAMTIIQHDVSDFGGDLGIMTTGPNYYKYAWEFLGPFLDAYTRLKDASYFTDYSSQFTSAGYYPIYMTNYVTGRTISIEDASAESWLTTGIYGTESTFEYLLAAKLNNGYFQYWADDYASTQDGFGLIWRQNISPVNISGLPVHRTFNGIGYFTVHESWDDTGTTMVFKCGYSMGHAHTNQNTFILLHNGVALSGDKGYLGNVDPQYNSSALDNCISVGTATLDGKQWGYGQAMEIFDGDWDATVPLGTTGALILTDAGNFYYVAIGDASDLYTGEVNSEPYRYPINSSGDADNVTRILVFVPDEGYLVIFDSIELPAVEPVHQMFSARDNTPFSSSGNIYYDTPSTGRIEIKPIFPGNPSSFTTAITADISLGILGLTSTSGTSPRLVTVVTPSNALTTGSLTTTAVNQGNCLGVIIDSADGKDLVLFSSDGNPVNQLVELGDYYRSADGNNYTFDGTRVLASFNNYQVMRLVLEGGNRAPVLAPIGNKSVKVQGTLQFTISATDPDFDALTYSASNLPAWASFNPATRTFSGTPTQTGTYTNVRFEVTDGELTDFENITITVTDNHAPVLQPIGDKTVNEGQQLQFTISATDVDNDALTYSASGLPSGASFNANSHTLSWTPDATQVGSHPDIHFEVTDGELSASEDITITVNSGASSPPGDIGGGGGGGSGGGGGITSLLDVTTADGKVISEVTATSDDGRLNLIIPEDTIVNNKGQRVGTIRIVQTAEPDNTGPDADGISLNYRIEPDGTAFDPYAILVYSYDDEDIPEGVSENSLFIALWDSLAQDWVNLGGTVDPVANTVTVQVQHLSIYALQVHIRPASFKVTNLSLTPLEVGPGETVAVSLTVDNSGDFTGTYEVVLKLDNTITQTRNVTLTGGESKTEIFNIMSNISGEHRIDVGDKSAVFLVTVPQNPASFTVSDILVTPAAVDLGEQVTINALVKNNGDVPGTYLVTLKIDDIAVQTQEISIAGGGSKTVSFSLTADSAGQHEVSIGSLRAAYDVMSIPAPLSPPVTETPGLQIDTLNVALNYNEHINKLVSAEIIYRMNQPFTSLPDARLILKVFYNDELVETIPLLILDQLQLDGRAGEFSYIPSVGWMAGNYTFKAELYDGENLVQETSSPRLVVTPEVITKTISWWILGAVIGVALCLISIVVALVIYHRRDMLKDQQIIVGGP
jgi:hypothetical protein